MNKLTFTQNLVSICFCFFSFLSHAQTITTFATGIPGPIGITRDADGNLWVGQPGTGYNDGKIVMINAAGTVFDAVTSLPSSFDTLEGNVAGPWRAHKEGNNLRVVIGGSPEPNAGTILTFDFTNWNAGDPAKTITDATAISDVQQFVLSNGFLESDPYSYTYDTYGNTFIADAAANAIIRQDAGTGSFSVVHTFDPFPNLYTPFPPVIDYVPTKIIANPQGGFYVCNLTGFPFVPGIATVDKMDVNGNITPFASGLSLLVDLDVDAPTGDVYALQFGVFDSTGPVFNSAKIIRIKTNGDTSTVIGGFGPSGGMVLDGNGGVYVTSLFLGAVLHISNVTTGIIEMANGNENSIIAFPNPFNENTTVHFRLSEASPLTIRVFNEVGAEVVSQKKFFGSGDQIWNWSGRNSNGGESAPGMYLVQLSGNNLRKCMTIVKQ